MSHSQSGAEEDNEALFGEQWMLLFSKFKMAPWKVGPIRSRLFKFKMAAPMKVRPCRKTAHQPWRRTGIGLTDFYGDTNHARVTQKCHRGYAKCHATSKSILTVSWGPKWQKSVQQAAMIKTERLGSEVWLLGAVPKHHGMMTSSGSNQNELKYWLLPSPLS